MTMFKLETMIYASEDGTSSVFTLNPDLHQMYNIYFHIETTCRPCYAASGGVLPEEKRRYRGSTVSIKFSHENLYLIALVEDVKALLSIFVHKL